MSTTFDSYELALERGERFRKDAGVERLLRRSDGEPTSTAIRRHRPAKRLSARAHTAGGGPS